MASTFTTTASDLAQATLPRYGTVFPQDILSRLQDLETLANGGSFANNTSPPPSVNPPAAPFLPLAGGTMTGSITMTAGKTVIDEFVTIYDFASSGTIDPAGVADSTAAFQAAINGANGRTIFVPPGVYLVHDLSLANTSGARNVHLAGLGNPTFRTYSTDTIGPSDYSTGKYETVLKYNGPTSVQAITTTVSTSTVNATAHGFSNGQAVVFTGLATTTVNSLVPNATGSSITGVASTVATSLFTKTSHGLVNGQQIDFATTGTGTTVLPGQAGNNGAPYWVVNAAANTFQVAKTLGGTAVTFTGTDATGITVNLRNVFYVVNAATDSFKLSWTSGGSAVTFGGSNDSAANVVALTSVLNGASYGVGVEPDNGATTPYGLTLENLVIDGNSKALYGVWMARDLYAELRNVFARGNLYAGLSYSGMFQGNSYNVAGVANTGCGIEVGRAAERFAWTLQTLVDNHNFISCYADQNGVDPTTLPNGVAPSTDDLTTFKNTCGIYWCTNRTGLLLGFNSSFGNYGPNVVMTTSTSGNTFGGVMQGGYMEEGCFYQNHGAFTDGYASEKWGIVFIGASNAGSYQQVIRDVNLGGANWIWLTGTEPNSVRGDVGVTLENVADYGGAAGLKADWGNYKCVGWYPDTAFTGTQPAGSFAVQGSLKGTGARSVIAERYGASAILEGRRINGSVGSPTAVLSAQNIMQFVVQGQYDTTRGHLQEAATIQAQASQDWSSGKAGSGWIFQTVPNDSTTPTTSLVLGQDQAVEAYGLLRVRSNLTYVPTAVSVTAAGTTLPISGATLIDATLNTSDITSTFVWPTTLPDGTFVELLNDPASAYNLTLHNDATRNLVLNTSGSTLTLTPGDSIRLIYRTALTAWLQLGQASGGGTSTGSTFSTTLTDTADIGFTTSYARSGSGTLPNHVDFQVTEASLTNTSYSHSITGTLSGSGILISAGAVDADIGGIVTGGTLTGTVTVTGRAGTWLSLSGGNSATATGSATFSITKSAVLPTLPSHIGLKVPALSAATQNLGILLDGSSGAAAGSTDNYGLYARTPVYLGGDTTLRSLISAVATLPLVGLSTGMILGLENGTASPTAGTILGAVAFQGITTGSTVATGASINGVAEGTTWDATHRAARLELKYSTATAATLGVVLNSAGVFGVGSNTDPTSDGFQVDASGNTTIANGINLAVGDLVFQRWAAGRVEGTNASTSPILDLRYTAAGPTSGTVLSALTLGGITTGTTRGTGVSIRGVTDGAWSSGHTASRLEIQIGGSGGSAAQALVLDSSGNLGLGTSTTYNSNPFYVVGSSGNVVTTGTLAVTGHTTFEGVTSTGATGTGKLVYDGTPTLVTPVLGVATGTSIAFTGGANQTALSVYQEGTWTPNFQGTTGSAGTAAVSQQTGHFTRVGRIVFLQCRMTITNVGSWTGNFQLTGLPYTVSNTIDVGAWAMQATSLNATPVSAILRPTQNAKTADMFIRTAASASDTAATVANVGATGVIIFAGAYITSDAAA